MRVGLRLRGLVLAGLGACVPGVALAQAEDSPSLAVVQSVVREAMAFGGSSKRFNGCSVEEVLAPLGHAASELDDRTKAWIDTVDDPCSVERHHWSRDPLARIDSIRVGDDEATAWITTWLSDRLDRSELTLTRNPGGVWWVRTVVRRTGPYLHGGAEPIRPEVSGWVGDAVVWVLGQLPPRAAVRLDRRSYLAWSPDLFFEERARNPAVLSWPEERRPGPKEVIADELGLAEGDFIREMRCLVQRGSIQGEVFLGRVPVPEEACSGEGDIVLISDGIHGTVLGRYTVDIRAVGGGYLGWWRFVFEPDGRMRSATTLLELDLAFAPPR